MCEELKLPEMIDIEVGETAHNKHISFGQLVVCMILNGLSFVRRILYLFIVPVQQRPPPRFDLSCFTTNLFQSGE